MCLYIWCICFGLTFLGFLLELGSLFKLPLCNIRSLLRLSDKFQYHLPLSWDGRSPCLWLLFCGVLPLSCRHLGYYISSFLQAPPEIASSPPPAPAWLLCFAPSKWPGSVRRPSRVSCFGRPSQVCSGGWRTMWPTSLPSSATLTCPCQPAWCGVWLCTSSASSWGVNYLVNGCDCDNDKKLPLHASPFYCGCRLCSPSSSTPPQ